MFTYIYIYLYTMDLCIQTCIHTYIDMYTYRCMPTYTYTTCFFHNYRQCCTLTQKITACLGLPSTSSCGQKGTLLQGANSCKHKVNATEGTPQDGGGSGGCFSLCSVASYWSNSPHSGTSSCPCSTKHRTQKP